MALTVPVEQPRKKGSLSRLLVNQFLGGGCGGNGMRAPLGEEELKALVAATGLDPSEVEGKYTKFLEQHPEGRIDKKEFKRMVGDSIPGGNGHTVGGHVWRIYDTNMDGRIDFSEFMVALQIMNNGTLEENLEQIFRVFDINNDGRIEKREMRRIVKDLGKMVGIKDKDEASREAFKEMDEDGDGEVTKEEFVKACLNQKKFSVMLILLIIDIFLSN